MRRKLTANVTKGPEIKTVGVSEAEMLMDFCGHILVHLFPSLQLSMCSHTCELVCTLTKHS